MTRLLWTFGWIGVAVWSLICAAAYGLLDLAGRVATRNADAFSGDPATVEWIWRVFNALHSLSTGAVLVTWAVVSLLILAVPWALGRMVGGAGPARPAAPVGRTQPFGRTDEGVIDLAPDQYSVNEPNAAGRAGSPRSVPGVTPRL